MLKLVGIFNVVIKLLFPSYRTVSLNLCKKYLKMAIFKIPVLLLITSWTLCPILKPSYVITVTNFKKMVRFFGTPCVCSLVKILTRGQRNKGTSMRVVSISKPARSVQQCLSVLTAYNDVGQAFDRIFTAAKWDLSRASLVFIHSQWIRRTWKQDAADN